MDFFTLVDFMDFFTLVDFMDFFSMRLLAKFGGGLHGLFQHAIIKSGGLHGLPAHPIFYTFIQFFHTMVDV